MSRLSLEAQIERLSPWITLAFRGILLLVVFSATSYMDSHYVNKPYFDSAIAKVESGQREIGVKVESGQREISAKVDAVLIQQATATAKREELERRLIRIENWREGSVSKASFTLSANP